MINMTEGRYVGKLHNQTKKEIHIIDEDQIILSEKEAYNEKIFLATQANHYKEKLYDDLGSNLEQANTKGEKYEVWRRVE